jgi:regulator of CtrA degradation
MRKMTQVSAPNVTPFANAQAFAASEVFRKTFSEGMAMVEETATYLDGRGRNESRALPSKAALAYAGESMRLTTRLMQIASWLLVQRAVSEGEMTPEEASRDKYRLGAKEICRGRRTDIGDVLPPKLVELLDRSATLYERVERLDQSLYSTEQADTGLQTQLSRLQMAFGGQKAE